MRERFLQALVDAEDAIPLTRLTPGVKEGLIVFGAITVVIVAILTGFALARKRRRRRSRRHHVPAVSAAGVSAEADSERRHFFRRERHRRRRRRHGESPYTRRNPTLAETGGLPPKREPGQATPTPAPPPAPPAQP